MSARDDKRFNGADARLAPVTSLLECGKLDMPWVFQEAGGERPENDGRQVVHRPDDVRLRGLFVFAAVTRSASAQGDGALCHGPNATLEQRVTACSSIIASGNTTGRDLAAAYAQRGYAYTLKRKLDLKPKRTSTRRSNSIPTNAIAFVDRANFWNVMRQARSRAWPTANRRSSSIRNCRSLTTPMPARALNLEANMTAPSPITARRCGCGR